MKVNYIKNAINHYKTIAKHRRLVRKYCFRAGLYKQGLTHDLSKYSPTEFLVGCRFYQGTRSPNNAEREQTGYSKSWLHHKGRNKHHFEYWIDYSVDYSDPHVIMGYEMPRKYVAEMIFDRVSASKVYRGNQYKDSDPLEYFYLTKDRCWFIHSETLRQMETLLKMWSEKGEDYTVDFIKNKFLKKKRNDI